MKLFSFALLAAFLGGLAHAAPERSLVIAVDQAAPPEIQAAAQAILAGANAQPCLVPLAAGERNIALVDTTALAAAKPEARADKDIIVVGLPGDPLITAAWQREALLKDGDFYIFGFGHFKGDIGYVESDRNPFLHSKFIPTAPFETEIVTLTGSTPAGVALAAQAFLNKGLINGVVARPGWTRSAPNLLQHDPLDPAFALPDWVPAQLGEWTKVGVTQSAEDEYRGVLQDTDVEPQKLWRVKYTKPGVWDAPGALAAFDNYSAGLHRRAYGNTLWLARFASPEEAAAALPKIAREAHLPKRGEAYVGNQPPYGTKDNNPLGPLSLWQRGDWLLMSTLPRGSAEAGLPTEAAK